MAQQLTVGELIDQLSTFDRDGLVHLEGCDCYTKAVIVQPYNPDEFDNPDILIREMNSYNEAEEIRNTILAAMRNARAVTIEFVNGKTYRGNINEDYGDTFSFTDHDRANDGKNYQMFYAHIKKVTHV